jgi:hypothetical protein
MAEVKNTSYVAITRKVGRSRLENLANQLFNGYVYNMSVEVGYGGTPSVLTLNLALNKTLDKVPSNRSAIEERKKDIDRVNALIESQKTGNISSVGNLGNAGNGAYLGAQHNIAKIADEDFNIDPKYIGMSCSYDIAIYNGSNVVSYEFKNFKISSFAISKRNNQKILTLTLLDNSFALDKIYVGLLGREIALDARSESQALVSNIQIACPPVGPACPGGSTVTTNNLQQTLHFSNLKFLQEYTKNAGIGSNKDFQSLNFTAGDQGTADKENYVIVKSTSENKSIHEGYGAVIVLGEEEFKDAPCSGAEVTYTFGTLLKAIQALGIVLGDTGDADAILKDKSNGKIRRGYTGTLRSVLSAWAEDFAFTYSLDFNESKLTLKGIDLSSSFTKENLLQTKLNLENAESESSQNSFVIRSQDLSYDLSRQQLKLYSSYYYKEAKDASIEYEQDKNQQTLYNINLADQFPSMFRSNEDPLKYPRDFSGSFRTYNQVVLSAILGAYSPDLRDIFNYSIGAYQALGFIPYNDNPQKVPLSDYAVFDQAIEQVAEISANNFQQYEFNFGFYNPNLKQAVLEMEQFIYNFIGRYYWAPHNFKDGEFGNQDFYTKYEVNTTAPVEKVLVGELYSMPVFREARYLLQKIASVYSYGDTRYFDAFSEFINASISTINQCQKAQNEFSKINSASGNFNEYYWFHERSDAAYAGYQELIDDLTKLKITGFSETTATPALIDLGAVYSPKFQLLTPVSLAALQAVMPINLQNVQFGSFQFGILYGIKNNNQIFNFRGMFRAANPTELQNRIYRRCSEILKFSSSGRESVVLRSLKSCSKTLLYETCVRPCEDAAELKGLDDALAFASGPDPASSRFVRITRNNWNIQDDFIRSSLFQTEVSNNYNLSLAQIPLNTGVAVQGLRSGTITYAAFKNRSIFESIVTPSEGPFSIRIYAKTTYKYFKPFQNYVKGGLESIEDLHSIINNKNFSLKLDVNNITPNLRELFSDDTNPEFISSSVGIRTPSNSPQYIQYQGYTEDNPAYAFTTFNQYHNGLKEVFDASNSSMAEPNLKFSADIFCSEITSTLRDSLSIDNGLTSLNINISSEGLTIGCSFESSPAQMENLDALLIRNRPNIKLINTNVFQ